MMNLEWMAWTMPTAIFFTTIISILIAMTIWQIVSPCVKRRGFLPISTTRGDRLFIGLLSSAYIHLAWLGLTPFSLWFAFAGSLVWMGVVMCWG